MPADLGLPAGTPSETEKSEALEALAARQPPPAGRAHLSAAVHGQGRVRGAVEPEIRAGRLSKSEAARRLGIGVATALRLLQTAKGEAAL